MDQVSRRPDFAVACYSGYLKDKDKDEIRPGFPIPADVPPVFLAHASDDNTSYGGSISENSAIMYTAEWCGRPDRATELVAPRLRRQVYEKLPSRLQSRGLSRP